MNLQQSLIRLVREDNFVVRVQLGENMKKKEKR